MDLTAGNYILKEKIADGGMGEVFKAVKKGVLGFEKSFVLKRLLPYYADNREFIEMLIKEARISSLLDHPNIVQTLDFFELGGDFFLVMEYVCGKDLGEIISRARNTGTNIDPYLSLFVMAEAMKGLAHAHNFAKDGEPLRIVHRDISPQNILVSYSGRVKITDFGIASTVADERRTKTGEIKGKLNYLSPEQIKKDPLDERSDIFSASSVLYEMLTLRRPFEQGSEYETMKKIAEAAEGPSFERDVLLSDQVIALLTKGLKKEPKDRFQSSRDFLNAILVAIPEEFLRQGEEKLKGFVELLFPPVERSHSKIEKTPILRSLSSSADEIRAKSLISVEQSIKRIRRRKLMRYTAYMASSTLSIIALVAILRAVLPPQTADRTAAHTRAQTLPGIGERATGKVSINSKPKAKVYINGKDFGDTPIRRLTLKSGDYLLNLVFPGGRNLLKSFQVIEGQDKTIFEKLPEK